MSINIVNLQKQVQLNCHISDANFSGTFSLCMLLLRLRNLYKWEMHMPPWEEPAQSDLLQWVEEREKLWMDLEGKTPSSIYVNGHKHDCMEALEINSMLSGTDLFYGAGLVTGMKPSFFLARPVEEWEQDGLKVCIVDHELSRDIFSAPLMRQGDRIIARRQSMATLLWDEVLELRGSTCKALAFAFAQYGLDLHRLRKFPVNQIPKFYEVVDSELKTWVHHETGEANVDAFPEDTWQRMVSEQANTLVEVFVRAVRDLLADTHPLGVLGHIVREKKSSSLGFYIAFMRPLTKALYPEIIPAVNDFMNSPDWTGIEKVRLSGYNRGHELALRLVDIYQSETGHDPEAVREKVVNKLIRPLGILDSLAEENQG